MAAGQGKQVFLATIYFAGVIGLCVALGLAAGDAWVGILCFGGLVALQIAAGRTAEGKLSNVLLLGILGAWAISAAGTLAEYAGRWLWAIPWTLGGVLLLGIGFGARGRSQWVSQGGYVLGVWSLVWAVVGPVWLYGKSQAETRTFFADLLRDWWWVGLLALGAILLVSVVVGVVSARRRRHRWEVVADIPVFRPLGGSRGVADNPLFGQQPLVFPPVEPEPAPEPPAAPVGEPAVEPAPAPTGFLASEWPEVTAPAPEPRATVFAGDGADGQGTLLYELPGELVDLAAHAGDHFVLTDAGRLVRWHAGETADVPGVALYRPLGLGVGGDVVVAADAAAQLVSVDCAGETPRVHHHDVEDELACFAINPYGTIVAYASAQGPDVHAVLLEGGDRQLLTADAGRTSAMAFSGDGRVLALGGEDGRLHLFDMTTRRIERTLAPPEGEHGRVRALAECPQDGWLAGYASGAVARWDASGMPAGIVHEPHHVCAVAVGARARRVAVGCEDGHVVVHPLELDTTCSDVALAGERVVHLEFEEDGPALVAAGSDGAVRRTTL